MAVFAARGKEPVCRTAAVMALVLKLPIPAQVVWLPLPPPRLLPVISAVAGALPPTAAATPTGISGEINAGVTLAGLGAMAAIWIPKHAREEVYSQLINPLPGSGHV